MADRNPNITGGDLAPVEERTGAPWRYKQVKMGDLTFPDRDNRLSDNDDYQQEFPMDDEIRR